MNDIEFLQNPDIGQPEKLHIQLCHYKQNYNWDCGLSCILMVLPQKSRQDFILNFGKICREEGFNKSTWTIDLCYLLKKYHVKHTYLTITLGIHPGHITNSFYNSILSKDEARIKSRFDNAELNGITIKKASVPLEYILDQLRNGPIIVLTNNALLFCDKCKYNKLRTELRKCLPFNHEYQGHYIVLCGYDINFRKVYFRNPSFADHVCLMSMEGFEEARKYNGTDEDLIFIDNSK